MSTLSSAVFNDSNTILLDPRVKKQTNIILIGETGVGKTSLLDLLGNVCAGVPLEHFKPVHNSENERGGFGTQTSRPLLYNTISPGGHQVKLLDTPGLADTRGPEWDREHRKAIVEAIKKDMDAIDAILILLNGSAPRMSGTTAHALSVITSMLPSSIVNNIGLVFTMVPDPLYFNFDRSLLPKTLQRAPTWSMDNPVSLWAKYQEKKNQSPPPRNDILKQMERRAREGYEATLKLFSASSEPDGSHPLLQWLDERAVHETYSIVRLDEMSVEIEASIADTIAIIAHIEDLRSQLAHLENDKFQHKQVKNMLVGHNDELSKQRYEAETAAIEKISATMEIIAGNRLKCEEQKQYTEGKIFELCSRYNDLVLSGSLVGHIASAINYLKLREAVMRQEGESSDVLERMASQIRGMEEMKRVIESATKQK